MSRPRVRLDLLSIALAAGPLVLACAASPARSTVARVEPVAPATAVGAAAPVVGATPPKPAAVAPTPARVALPAAAPPAPAPPLAAPAPAPAPEDDDDRGPYVQRVPLAPFTPVRGPKDAKVTIVVFSDFECPFCGRLLPTLSALERRHGDDVRVAFRNLPLPFHAHAAAAAEAAMAANGQGRFWPMHDLLFAHQDALETSDLIAYARRAGLDVKRFRKDLASHRYQSQVEADARAAEAAGAHGTPTLFVNGRGVVGAQPLEAIAPLVERERARADRILAEGTPRERLYDAVLARLATRGPAEEHRRAEDDDAPEQPVDVRVGDAPARGPDGAAVTIVEFADFQCGFCARVEPTLAALRERHPTDVRLVFMQYPLPFHPDARLAAEAALAADAQGRFWPMHDRLFAHEGPLSRADVVADARAIGLDTARFERDLDEGRTSARLADQMAEAERVGVHGTPSFFVNGRPLVGAQPASRFEALIEQARATRK